MAAGQQIQIMRLNPEDLEEIAKEESNSVIVEGLPDSHQVVLPLTNTGAISYVCSLCEQRFDCEQNLLQHRIRHDKCLVCLKPFSCQKKLFVHSSLECKSTPDFLCLFCRRVLGSRENLELHLVEHEQEVVYECDVCGNRFLSKDEACIHKLTVHKVNANKPTSNQSGTNADSRKRKIENDTSGSFVSLEPQSQVMKTIEAGNEIKKFRISRDGLVMINEETANQRETTTGSDGYASVQEGLMEGGVVLANNNGGSDLGEVVELRLADSSADKDLKHTVVALDDLYSFQGDGNVQILNLDADALSNINIPTEYVVNEDGTLQLQVAGNYQGNGTQPRHVFLQADQTSAYKYREVKEDEDPFKCGYCSQPYSDSMELFLHMTQEHYDRLDKR